MAKFCMDLLKLPQLNSVMSDFDNHQVCISGAFKYEKHFLLTSLALKILYRDWKIIIDWNIWVWYTMFPFYVSAQVTPCQLLHTFF